MIKRILQVLFLLSMCISAHSQAVNYNAIATAYVTTTISQNVVFDSTMQQGGTFTFSVLAHNGGGRAGQSDTANVRIQFFNAAGQQIGTTAQTNYSANLPNPNAVCGNPCIDSSVPWSTLAISSTLSAADAANVAYAKVAMYGIDGSYWAGDYGPWYRAPTFQLNGGGNLTYNPEFGPAYGSNAQGWTTSPAMGSCQGAWGGSNPCIVNDQGVPGTSTVGLVANQNGGGPSTTGGTTSGQAGGYNSTMSVTNAGAGTGQAAPTAPTVTSTVVTYAWRQVAVGNVVRIYRTKITTTNYSDNTSTSTSDPEILYSTATTTETGSSSYNTQAGIVTTVNKVTVTDYYDGTQTSSNSFTTNTTPWPSYVTVGGGTVSNDIIFGTANPITTNQQTKVDTWKNKTAPDGNQIYINQINGDQNSVTMDQQGNKNLIRLQLQGTNNNITARQGVTGVDQNEMKLNFEGNNNVVNVNQSRDLQGNAVGTNGHYLDATIAGWGTNLNIQQSNNGGVGGHYNETTIYGNGNSVTARQTDNGNKIMFLKVDGAINTIDATQKGSGQHRLEATLTGNFNNATVLQEGSVANNATLNLTNIGGPAIVNVQQNGGQSVGVTTSCATAGGCAAITVRQGY